MKTTLWTSIEANQYFGRSVILTIISFLSIYFWQFTTNQLTVVTTAAVSVLAFCFTIYGWQKFNQYYQIEKLINKFLNLLQVEASNNQQVSIEIANDKKLISLTYAGKKYLYEVKNENYSLSCTNYGNGIFMYGLWSNENSFYIINQIIDNEDNLKVFVYKDMEVNSE